MMTMLPQLQEKRREADNFLDAIRLLKAEILHTLDQRIALVTNQMNALRNQQQDVPTPQMPMQVMWQQPSNRFQQTVPNQMHQPMFMIPNQQFSQPRMNLANQVHHF